MSVLLVAAMDYRSRGLSVIPTKGKRPTIRAWKPYAAAPASEVELREWFGSEKPDGLAVICGPVSGNLCVRDFDEMESYNRWASAHPDFAAMLPTVETGRPGRHVYFRNDLHRIVKLSDGELRGAGYCLLPPSRHPSGKLYRWLIPLPDGPLPEVDPFAIGLAERVTERTEETEETEDSRAIEAQNYCSVVSVVSVLSVLSVSDDIAAAIRDAIESTLPKRRGKRNTEVFEFARALKAIAALADAEPRALRGVVKLWHQRAYPVISTKPFDQTWADFLYGWPRVKFPKGREPMAQILARADSSSLPEAAAMYDCPKTHRLIKVCRELQRASGDGPFFLSCRTAGDLLDLDHNTAWRRLGMLVSDGIIQTIEPGTKTKATRYRYVASDSPSRSNT